MFPLQVLGLVSDTILLGEMENLKGIFFFLSEIVQPAPENACTLLVHSGFALLRHKRITWLGLEPLLTGSCSFCIR